MALHLASLSNRGLKELGNDVLLFTFVSLILLFVPDALFFTKLCLKNTRNSLLCLCSRALFNKQKKLKCSWRFDVVLNRNIFFVNSWSRIFLSWPKKGGIIYSIILGRRDFRENVVYKKIRLLQYPLWF